MLRHYAAQVMSLYNYIDGLMIINAEGIVEYYATFRPDINNLREKEVINRHVLDIYPSLTTETSSLLRVLKSATPIVNEHQTLFSFKGQSINAVNTTLPIRFGDRVVGAVDVSRYIDNGLARDEIELVVPTGDNVSEDHDDIASINDIISCDYSMMRLKDKILKVATTDSSVMITGETGSGKGMAAQAIHSHSARKKGPFVAQNCAAIPSTLLESILFGTVRGAFTGAEDRKGLFEFASGGTLFLDEISSMEPHLQAKLLEAIEDRVIRRVGAIDKIATDVRILSAINENPFTAIDNNRLRSDLFYRLCVVQLDIPPLRKRRNDILFLANHFVRIYNLQLDKNIKGLSEDVERIFLYHDWPGNVRQLKNIIEGAFNLSITEFIRREDLPDYISTSSQDNTGTIGRICEGGLFPMVQAYEKEIIREALVRTGNKTKAAGLLRISKQTLNYKLSKYFSPAEFQNKNIGSIE